MLHIENNTVLGTGGYEMILDLWSLTPLQHLQTQRLDA